MARVTIDGLPAATLARRWGVPGCQLARSTGSTLDAAHRLGQDGAPAGTVVLAEVQTAGRGRDGRTWHSPEGGVWLALLMRPRAATPGIVSIRAGLVLADVIDELLGASVARLKWPNDVMLDDRKLAGVLCEGRWQGDELQWLAVGVGVNVVNPIPPALGGTAIALHEVMPRVRRIDVLDRLVPVLPRIVNHGARLSDGECAAFAARDWLRDRTLLRPVGGRVVGLRDDGALLVDTGSETVALAEGHIGIDS